MTNQHDQACQLMIEQEINDGLKKGETPYSIGKRVSKWISEIFEVKIPPNTIKQKARRKKLGTNVSKKNESHSVKPLTPSPFQDNPTPEQARQLAKDNPGMVVTDNEDRSHRARLPGEVVKKIYVPDNAIIFSNAIRELEECLLMEDEWMEDIQHYLSISEPASNRFEIAKQAIDNIEHEKEKRDAEK